MTEKVPLEAMIRRASRMAEEMFAAQGNVDTFWLVEAAGGEQRTLVTPMSSAARMRSGPIQADADRSGARIFRAARC